MPNGRFLHYHWQIHTLLSQNNHLYLDPQGSQVFRYDDAPHHLHRGQEDAVYALDLNHVDFATVLSKIVSRYLAHLDSTNSNSA